MLSILMWSLGTSFAINALLFIIAFRLQTDKLTDSSYAISFIALALLVLLWPGISSYRVIGVTLVCIWAIRIGSFLLYRVMQTGKDRRFDDIREHFFVFAKFWLGQACTVWILMLPILLTAHHQEHIAWRPLAGIGIAIWLVGLVIETVADLQKNRFHHNPKNGGHWIDSGLWHYSRHPNYFGEILIWLGIYCYLFYGLTADDRLIGLLSPLFITVLLLFVSGIPVLEKSAMKRWGSDPAYKAYVRHTSILIPAPRRKTTS